MSSQKELIKNLNEIKNQKETLLTPENIRAGVTLLGVEGSSEVVDTSDATADGDDILKGKVAYSKGYKKEDIVAIAISGDSKEFISPCGMCRQVICELMPSNATVYLLNSKQEVKEVKVKQCVCCTQVNLIIYQS